MIGLDTSFVLDLLEGKTDAVLLADRLKDESFAVSPITVFEVLVGIYSSKFPQATEENQALKFFDHVETIPFVFFPAQESAKLSGALARSGKPLQATDAMIAGGLQFHGCTSIITRDSDFKNIPGLDVINY